MSVFYSNLSYWSIEINEILETSRLGGVVPAPRIIDKIKLHDKVYKDMSNRV